MHPADLDGDRAAFPAPRVVAGAHKTDFRILSGDAVR